MKAIDRSASPLAKPAKRSKDIGKPCGEVLIVDDDPVVRELVSTVLKENGYGVTTAKSVEQAHSELRHGLFDLMLLDLIFPDQPNSGFDMMDPSQFEPPECPIVIITASSDLDSAIKALRFHVFDYLLKPIQFDELCDVTGRAIASRSSSEKVVTAGALKKSPKVNDLILTEREKQVFDLLSRGFHYAEAAELLNCRVSTIQTHVKHIYRKLNVHSCAEALHEGRRLGLI